MTRYSLLAWLVTFPILLTETPEGLAQIPCHPVPAPSPGLKCYTTYKLHFLQRQKPAEKTTIKDCTTEECKPTLSLKWPEQQVQRCELALKPREIVKEVICCTMQPVVETDPCTGCQVTVLKPVTETKRITQIVYDLCPEEKTVRIQSGCLVPEDRIVKVRRLYLECTQEVRREQFAVLVPCEVHEHIIEAPIPCAHRKQADH